MCYRCSICCAVWRVGEEPALSSRTALASSELMFAAYESARQRAQVVLPLQAEDWAFERMLEDETLVAS
jgi:UDP-N-acetylglucosamine 3-dehydrogenase